MRAAVNTKNYIPTVVYALPMCYEPGCGAAKLSTKEMTRKVTGPGQQEGHHFKTNGQRHPTSHVV
jgi:hypothetical protein